MDVEASATNIKILPTKKSPYTFIKSFLPKTISEKISINIDDSNKNDEQNEIIKVM